MMRTTLLLATASGLLLFATGCSSTTEVSLDYNPSPGQMRQGAAQFTASRFRDLRGDDPLYLGTVRTHIGTSLEHIMTRIPVAQVVTNAFAHGLNARGMLTPRASASFIVTGEVQEFYCKLLVHPYAFARIRVYLLDAATRRVLFSQDFVGERQAPAYIPGSGPPVPLLQDLASRALQDAVDKALDDAGLRATAATGAAQPPARARPKFMPGML